MKRITVLLSLLMLTLLAGCGGPERALSAELELDLAQGELLSHTDSHGGFLGDGCSFTVMRFEDDSLLTSIRESGEWSPLPMNETARTLACGRESGGLTVGPYLTDGEGRPLLPETEHGFYRLIDRQPEDYKAEEPDMLLRYSFNFTLALYDSDTDTLYVAELDT